MPDNLKELARKCRVTLAQAHHWPSAVRLVWEATGWWTWAWVALVVAQGLLPAATAQLTRRVVNELVRAVSARGGEGTLSSLWLAAASLGAVLLLSELLRGAAAWVRTLQSELFWDHIQNRIHEKSASLDLAFYDSPEFHDRLHRVTEDAGTRPLALLENLGGVLQSALSLAAMGMLLAQYGIGLPALLLASALPALTAVLYYSHRQYEWRRRVTPEERRMWYFNQLLTSREPAAELRLFGLGERFRRLYAQSRRQVREESLRLHGRERLAELGAGAVALLAAGGAFAVMTWRTVRGAVTPGDLALFAQAFVQGQQFVRTLLGNAGQIYRNTLFLGDMFEFLALEPAIVAPAKSREGPSGLREQIRFDHVTFRYPGGNRDVLRDFNLVLPAGKIVAIVGRNGSGKSTLVRLLCRLYDPVEGRIEWDGVDMREFSPTELRRQITALFQEPVRYSATVAENIAWDAPDSVRNEAAIAAGADELARRLGYERLLGRNFEGGTDLSAGEWQRLALARAFARNASLVLLDEATSAMDSWAEAEWLRRLRSVAAGKTVVMITHRFTTAKQADVIYVMDDGRIVESGAHEELLRHDGLYAQSWRTQAEENAHD